MIDKFGLQAKKCPLKAMVISILLKFGLGLHTTLIVKKKYCR